MQSLDERLRQIRVWNPRRGAGIEHADKGGRSRLRERRDGPRDNGAMKLLSAQGTGICVGLGHITEADSDKPTREVIGCLKEGVPCFFWLAKPPRAGLDARTTLCHIFSQQKASEAPMAISKLSKAARGSDPLSSICLVWDEPGYLPSMQTFESPA
jgi:hypothetical protein